MSDRTKPPPGWDTWESWDINDREKPWSCQLPGDHTGVWATEDEAIAEAWRIHDEQVAETLAEHDTPAADELTAEDPRSPDFWAVFLGRSSGFHIDIGTVRAGVRRERDSWKADYLMVSMFDLESGDAFECRLNSDAPAKLAAVWQATWHRHSPRGPIVRDAHYLKSRAGGGS